MQERYQYLFKNWNEVVALAFGSTHGILLTSVMLSKSATHFVLEYIFLFFISEVKTYDGGSDVPIHFVFI
jgi:hypothetical protein